MHKLAFAQARAIPRDQQAAALAITGLPRGQTASTEMMSDAFNAGWIAFEYPAAERRQETTTPKHVLRTHVG